MKIYTLALGELGANCYILETSSRKAMIIDPGDEAHEIVKTLASKELTPAMILLTHGHFDHFMAAGELAETFGISIFIHEADSIMLNDAEKSLYSFINPIVDFKPVENFKIFSEGAEFVVDDIKLNVIHTPGHSKGSVCFIGDGAIFTGDTLFAGSIGRTDPPFGNYDELILSLEKLKFLSENYTIFPGHGRASLLDYERENNIFLADFNQI